MSGDVEPIVESIEKILAVPVGERVRVDAGMPITELMAKAPAAYVCNRVGEAVDAAVRGSRDGAHAVRDRFRGETEGTALAQLLPIFDKAVEEAWGVWEDRMGEDL